MMAYITYDWAYEDYPGDASVTFELFEEGSSTRLRLTYAAREDFPQDVPEFRRESSLAGWQYFVQRSLKARLEGTEGKG